MNALAAFNPSTARAKTLAAWEQWVSGQVEEEQQQQEEQAADSPSRMKEPCMMPDSAYVGIDSNVTSKYYIPPEKFLKGEFVALALFPYSCHANSLRLPSMVHPCPPRPLTVRKTRSHRFPSCYPCGAWSESANGRNGHTFSLRNRRRRCIIGRDTRRELVR
ncbi:hypothetical protein BT69DRAFT_1100665 [Atractiella rhizophila]|nr:hypothetical protein BT69DRAFT_1100665 [Atractiella rhizophila]